MHFILIFKGALLVIWIDSILFFHNSDQFDRGNPGIVCSIETCVLQKLS